MAGEMTAVSGDAGRARRPPLRFLLVSKLYLGTGLDGKLSLPGKAFPSQAWKREIT